MRIVLFGEYLVGHALGCLGKPRVEWDGCDLQYRGKKIEVKASAYLQSWPQKRLSDINFNIAPHRAWDADSNTYAPEAARTADCYVFCLFTDKDRNDCCVTDAHRWEFDVLATPTMNQKFPGQKRAGISKIRRFSGGPVKYKALRDRIDTGVGRPMQDGNLFT